MTAATHIPGPWMADQENNEFPNQIVISNDNGRIVAVCDNVDEQDVPTAILITAAPDLLEALEELLFGGFTEDARAKARTAIARATAG